MTPRDTLTALGNAVEAAKRLADHPDLFTSREMYALAMAFHDLTEIDAVYEWAGDVAAQGGFAHVPSFMERRRAMKRDAEVGVLIAAMNRDRALMWGRG